MREGVFSGLVFYACLLPALAGLVSSTAAAFSTVLVKFSPLFYPCCRVRAARFFEQVMVLEALVLGHLLDDGRMPSNNQVHATTYLQADE
jgi:hypothetical protein